MTSIRRIVVFVYGTLKRGQPNHGLLADPENGSAIFHGKGNTINKYPLVISSKYNIPFLLLQKDSGERIEGEIYKVDSQVLEELDSLEGHPDFYERFQTSIQLREDAEGTQLEKPEPIECWCYFLTKFKPKLLDLPFFSCYDAYGSHGLKYSAKYEREIETDFRYDLMGDVKCI